ncbi:MAG: SPOR domain-containing protein [Gammaproteobacteria bacterium]|nr:SPOR domain-containing protein [Gammaproteobacteria bacterium]MDH5594055.1 SPOR domain-containing protein [Gammaproteobacteria bacterium]
MEASRLQDLPYLTDFGLQRDPFSLAIEDDFFFNDSTHAQNLDLLQHALLSNELFMLVTGRFGIGKTILIRRLLSRLDDNYQVCFIHANPMHHADQLKQQIYKGLGADSSTESISGFDQLTSCLDNIKRSGRAALLIIDDAHELSIESLQLVMQLNDLIADDTHLLSIILFAEPDIQRLLETADPQKAGRLITQNLELQPLNEKDTENYLHYRMKVAGFDENNLTRTPFTPSTIETIYKNSKGIPFEINRQASKTLIRFSSKEPDVPAPAPTRKGRFTAASTLIMVLVVALLVVALVIQDTINSFFDPANYASTNENTPEIANNRIKREKVVSLIEPEIKVPQSTNSKKTEHPDSGDHKNLIAMGDSLKDPEIIPLPQDNPVDQDKNMIALLKDQKSEQELFKQIEEKKPEPDMIAEPEQETTLPPSTDSTEPETGSEKIIEKSTVVEKEALPVVTTSQEKDWLFEQSPWHYAVQIIGAKQKNTVDKFIAQNKIEFKPVIYVTTKNGNDWHMVFTGTYNDKQSAQQFIQTLPEKVQKANPWVRLVSEIQVEVLNDNNPKLETEMAAGTGIVNSPLGKKDWFLEQNPWHYTIQLLGSAKQQSLDKFIRRHKLNGKAYWFKTRRAGKDWYVLVYGVYPSEANARLALTELPPVLKSTSPWPRTLGSVQTAIIEAQ